MESSGSLGTGTLLSQPTKLWGPEKLTKDGVFPCPWAPGGSEEVHGYMAKEDLTVVLCTYFFTL